MTSGARCRRYEPPARRHVVVLLTPDRSGAIVDEPSTVSWPLDVIRRSSPAVRGLE
jgi:hypothetical protein